MQTTAIRHSVFSFCPLLYFFILEFKNLLLSVLFCALFYSLSFHPSTLFSSSFCFLFCSLPLCLFTLFTDPPYCFLFKSSISFLFSYDSVLSVSPLCSVTIQSDHFLLFDLFRALCLILFNYPFHCCFCFLFYFGKDPIILLFSLFYPVISCFHYSLSVLFLFCSFSSCLYFFLFFCFFCQFSSFLCTTPVLFHSLLSSDFCALSFFIILIMFISHFFLCVCVSSFDFLIVFF